MLSFETYCDGADGWVEVVRNNSCYGQHIGNISCSLMNDRHLFAPEDCVCLSIEEMILITDKMKELENDRINAKTA